MIFFPVWILSCLLKFSIWLNSLLQILHLYGFSPVCMNSFMLSRCRTGGKCFRAIFAFIWSFSSVNSFMPFQVWNITKCFWASVTCIRIFLVMDVFMSSKSRRVNKMLLSKIYISDHCGWSNRLFEGIRYRP